MELELVIQLLFAHFKGKTPLKFKKSRNFVQFSLILKPDFLANIDIWTEETCKNFKNGKSLRHSKEKNIKIVKSKTKMWFVVKVLKIEKGARGMKSGAGVGGEVGNPV